MFLASSLLWWLLLAIIPLILYLVRPKPKKAQVTTLSFFLRLSQEAQESNWLRRLKRFISLLLTILILAGIVIGLSRWVWTPPAEGVKSVVLLFDTSASMGATEEDDTRLDLAVRSARQRLAGVGSGVSLSVVQYDQRPQIRVAGSRDREEVDFVLKSLEPRPLGDSSAEALALAQHLATMEQPAEIWWFSDQAKETTNENEVPIRSFPIASPGVNAGITGFSLRRVPLEVRAYEAFLEVQSNEEMDVELEIRLDGELLSVRKVSLVSDRPAGLTLPVPAKETAQVLSVEVRAENDRLPIDNTLWAHVPPLKSLRVAWLAESPDPFTELALRSLAADGDLKISLGGKVVPEKSTFDLIIFDGWLPEKWPTDTPVVVIDPPVTGESGDSPFATGALAGGGIPVLQVRENIPEHPVLYGVASGRLSLLQTSVLRLPGGIEPLWLGSAGPLLAVGEVKDQRIAILAVDPDRCEQLPLLASYPLLLGNLVYWAAQDELAASTGNNLSTGTAVEVDANAELVWFRPEAGLSDAKPAGSEAGSTSIRELREVGVWQWQDEAGEMHRGAASLIDPEETMLKGESISTDGGTKVAANWWGGEMTAYIILGLLLLLVFESFLFHRHSVY